MRILAVISLLAATALAGCLDNNDLDTYSAPEVDPEQKVLPERKFEPVVTLDVNFLQFERGDNVVVTWEVSDLHDYPFPLTFIDWTLKYSGAPNFVAEGDATQLPGSYERIIYAEGFYRFTLDISDGQEFEETHEIIVKVGDPIVQEVVEATGGDSGVVYEPMSIDRSITTVASCKAGCMALGSLDGRSLKSPDCSGLHIQKNGLGCAWVELPPSAVGATFSVVTDAAGGDVDVVFLDRCAPFAFDMGRFGTGGGEEGAIPVGARCLMAYIWGDDVGAITIKVDEFQNAISGNIPYDTEPRLSFSTYPASACMEDVQSLRAQGFGYGCPGLMAGPYNGFKDGWWIPLDERYEGAKVVTNDVAETGNTDSDCLFLDQVLNIVGSAHNGLGPCGGDVPPGAHWMFIYSYIGPTPGMIIEFKLNEEKAAAAEALGRPVGETLMEDYEDLGSVWKHKDTNICYVKEYGLNFPEPTGIQGVPGFHYIAFGSWFFQETNGIPGLQVSQDDFGASTYAGSPAPDGCTGGDMTVL